MKRRHAIAGAVMISAFLLGIAVAWKQLRAAQARALSATPPPTTAPK